MPVDEQPGEMKKRIQAEKVTELAQVREEEEEQAEEEQASEVGSDDARRADDEDEVSLASPPPIPLFSSRRAR